MRITLGSGVPMCNSTRRRIQWSTPSSPLSILLTVRLKSSTGLQCSSSYPERRHFVGVRGIIGVVRSREERRGFLQAQSMAGIGLKPEVLLGDLGYRKAGIFIRFAKGMYYA